MLTLNEDYLSLQLHICDYVAVGSLYSITLLMLSLSEMPGLNSKVPFTCVCRTFYGPLVLSPNLQVFHFFNSLTAIRFWREQKTPFP
jgi:hypothetical protein